MAETGDGVMKTCGFVFHPALTKTAHQRLGTQKHNIDTIASDLGILRDDHKKLADKVHTVESTLTELAPQQARNSDNLAFLHRLVQRLHDQAEDAEDIARQNNLGDSVPARR
ncbi:hypothetical protein NDU88_003029 [Pleurodeles waltl]|uniref:Uncharacterized protein n=1 Tax=Pleurodeles waltl TaxID=8319 RepID=A0AAV7NKA2_PLEWA|nr:hypothetical protein NDU88_003029 [Pleurodeles waltl]